MRHFPLLTTLPLSVMLFASFATEAAQLPKPWLPALTPISEALIASRLPSRFRFRVRPSRYRVGAFSRGQGCPQDAQTSLQPIAPRPYEESSEETAIELAQSTANSEAEAEVSPSINLDVNLEDTDFASIYLNASPHPIFFIKSPALPGAIGTLYVDRPDLDYTERQQYKVEFDMPDSEGILGVHIPESLPPLQPGMTYQWRLYVECSPEDERFDVIGLQTAAQFEQVANIEGSEDEQLAYYLEGEIWQSTVELLATDRYYNPSPEANKDWATLMEASRLPQFANTPIVSIQEGRLVED